MRKKMEKMERLNGLRGEKKNTKGNTNVSFDFAPFMVMVLVSSNIPQSHFGHSVCVYLISFLTSVFGHASYFVRLFICLVFKPQSLTKN